MSPEHDLRSEEYHGAGRELTSGNPEACKRLYSRREDVTLANPFGPPVRGWSEVSATLDRAAENYRDCEAVGLQNVSTGIGSDLAYTVEVESYSGTGGRAEEIAQVAVRVTTVFRREEGMWKVVHRHADPITAPRPRESVLQTQPASAGPRAAESLDVPSASCCRLLAVSRMNRPYAGPERLKARLRAHKGRREGGAMR